MGPRGPLTGSTTIHRFADDTAREQNALFLFRDAVHMSRLLPFGTRTKVLPKRGLRSPLPDAVRRALDQQKQTFQNLLRAKDEIISRYEAQLDSVSKRAELEKAELQKLDQDRANQLDFLENQANRLEDEATKTRSAASAAMASQQEKERASQQATDHLQAECVRLRGEIERVKSQQQALVDEAGRKAAQKAAKAFRDVRISAEKQFGWLFQRVGT